MPKDNTLIPALQTQFAHMHALSRQVLASDWSQREQLLSQLERMLLQHKNEIVAAINADFGHRPAAETIMLEFYPSLEGIRQMKRKGKCWLKPKRVRTSFWFLPAKSEIHYQPLGVVGIMVPWNYPLYLTIEPLAAALCAGNRAMLKLSEHTPHFNQWLANTLPQYFAADEIYLAQGDSTLAQAFSQLPFDHLFFTGSIEVGKAIMRAAAENLTPVTLELGGKSPAILAPSANLADAVNRIWRGKMINAGQTCIAPDYVWLPESMKGEFIAQSQAWIAKHYPKLAPPSDYSLIINHQQHQRLQGYLNEAQALGAEVITLADRAPNDEPHLFVPHIVSGLSESAKLSKEEIFGPILPIKCYQHLDEAIAYINQHPRPLALYLFAHQDDDIQKVLHHTISGGVCINETIFHIAQPNLPFGGVGSSGMGHYHGWYGFATFSHSKSVFIQRKINFSNILRSPYRRLFWQLMNFLTR